MGKVKIFAYKKEKPISQKQRDRFLSFLSDDEKERAEKFKRRADSDISILSRYLLRKFLSLSVDCDPEKIIFNYNEYNRPTLRKCLKEKIDFNVSHSGEWIIIAINNGGQVGIDIEKIKKIEKDVANNCFTEEEIKYLYSTGSLDLEKFFRLWVLKESFIKADGRGLSYSLKDFYFEIKEKIKLNAKRADSGWYFKEYNLDPKYKMALCLDQDVFPEKIEIIYDLIKV